MKYHLFHHSPAKPGWTMATFVESPALSTYSLAFLVANLESKTLKHRETELLVTVWADEDLIGRMESTLTWLMKVYHFYFEYFESKPSIDELHLIALPNFREMKTEKSSIILLK